MGQIRNPMLYPIELRARVVGISTLTHSRTIIIATLSFKTQGSQLSGSRAQVVNRRIRAPTLPAFRDALADKLLRFGRAASIDRSKRHRFGVVLEGTELQVVGEKFNALLQNGKGFPVLA